MAKKEPDIRDALEHLYFVEGLEDLRHLSGLKPKYLHEWSTTTGERLCRAIFDLINNVPPHLVLKELQQTYQPTPHHSKQ